MAIDRDALRETIENLEEQYDSIIGKRGRPFIQQYLTKRLKYPSDAELQNITTIRHVWKVGDKFWKLAQTHYGDSQLWWLIAWFNQMPTEAHLGNGTTVLIPFPVERLYRYFGI
tara:strand:+ start:151 stop:492 length:342 start_codon:yes stop_codon:yes gene_type:complete